MTNAKTVPRYAIQGRLGMNLHLNDIGPEGSRVTFEPGEITHRIAVEVTGAGGEYVSLSGSVMAVSGGLVIPLALLSQSKGEKISIVVRELPGEFEEIVLNVTD